LVEGLVRGCLLAHAAWIAAATANAGDAETFAACACNFVIRGFGGDVSRVAILIDTSGKAFTVDRDEKTDQPKLLPVKARRSGPDNMIYTYSFSQPHPDTGTLRVDAQIRIPKAGGASRISMAARGYSGNPVGQGKCNLERNVKFP
jgi:hypothetical protein